MTLVVSSLLGRVEGDACMGRKKTWTVKLTKQKRDKKKEEKGTSLGHRYVSSRVIARNMGVVVVGV